MAGIRPGTLRGEDHWARADHTHGGLPIAFAAPVAIDADDAQAEGVAATFARSDHQHAFTSAAAAALTKTATAGEGAAASHARSDHVHSTAALPWGIVAYQQLTTNNAHTVDGTSDFSLANVTPDITRLYAVTLTSQYSMNAAGDWLINLHDGGTAVARLKRSFAVGATGDTISSTVLWLPSTGTARTLDVRLDELAGAATFQFEAGAGAPRFFFVQDIGPR